MVPKGTGARKRLKLHPWQRAIVRGVLDEARPRQGLVGIPASNGKSTLAAAMGPARPPPVAYPAVCRPNHDGRLLRQAAPGSCAAPGAAPDRAGLWGNPVYGADGLPGMAQGRTPPAHRPTKGSRRNYAAVGLAVALVMV